MADKEDKNTMFVREEVDNLRREIRDIHDTLAVRSEKTASHAAVQTTLAVIVLIVLVAALYFSFAANNSVTQLESAHKDLLEKLKSNNSDIENKYAEAVVDLEKVTTHRDEVARKLAGARQELSELRLELQSGRSSGRKELRELQKKYDSVVEKCMMLEREAERTEALEQQLKAVRDETESMVIQYKSRITELEKTIKELKNRKPVVVTTEPKCTTRASIEPEHTTGPEPSPTESKSPKDIKKDKERTLEDL